MKTTVWSLLAVISLGICCGIFFWAHSRFSGVISLIISGIVGVIIAIIVFLNSKCTVPEKEIWLTEIFKKFERELEPGWHFLAPFIEKAQRKCPISRQMLRMVLDGVDVSDASLGVTACFYYRINNPYLVAYDIGSNFGSELKQKIESVVRNYLAIYKLDEAINLKRKFTQEIIACGINLISDPDPLIIKSVYETSEFYASLASMGIEPKGLNIEDFALSPDIVKQREKSLIAREEKEATEINLEKKEVENKIAISDAEAKKKIAILKAEGEAASMDAILKAVKDGEFADYLIQLKKWEAISNSKSNDKVIVLEDGNQIGNGAKFGIGSSAVSNK